MRPIESGAALSRRSLSTQERRDGEHRVANVDAVDLGEACDPAEARRRHTGNLLTQDAKRRRVTRSDGHLPAEESSGVCFCTARFVDAQQLESAFRVSFPCGNLREMAQGYIYTG